MKRKQAFTLVEMLVLIGIIAVFVAILVPVVMTRLARTGNYLAVCQNNLNLIGRTYCDPGGESPTYDVFFPRHIDDGDAHDTTASTGLKTADTVDATLGTCGMQAVWQGIYQRQVPEAAFKCPGDADWTPRDTTDKYGWSALTEFSYGVHYPYASDGAGTRNPADLNARDATIAQRLIYKENLVQFADRNPGGAVDGTTRFHSNHTGSGGGCVVANRVGVTRFYESTTDSKAGEDDDIYTDEANTASPVPDSITDTVITPQNSR